MALVENAVAGFLTVFSLLLAVLAVLAYRRSENRKVLGIAAAFAVFFTKGLLLTAILFTSTALETVWIPTAALDSVALVMFYASALTPKESR